MAISAGPCGTAYILFDFQKARRSEPAKIVLGYQEMSSRTKRKMPGMGISGRAFVLVYQWDAM
jgi:hypothetical protein